MKNGVTIVNTSRGDLIDEEAMIHALEGERCGVLVWTVFDNVPQVDRRLLGNERVVGLSAYWGGDCGDDGGLGRLSTFCCLFG